MSKGVFVFQEYCAHMLIPNAKSCYNPQMPPPPTPSLPNISRRLFLKQLDEYYRPFYGVIIVLLGLIALRSLVDLAAPYFFGRIVDALFAGTPYSTILLFAFFAFASYLASILVMHITGRYQNERFNFDIPRAVSNKALRRIFSFSMGQLTHENSAVKQTVMLQGEAAIKGLIDICVLNIAPLLLQAIVAIIMLSFFDPVLGFTLFAGITIFLVWTLFFSRRFYREIKSNKEAFRAHERQTTEAVRYATLVKANAREDELATNLDHKREEVSMHAKDLWRRFAVAGNPRFIVSECARFGVIALGAWFVVIGKHTPGELVIYLSWATSAFNGMGRIGMFARQMIDHTESTARYFAMLTTPPAIVPAERPVVLSPLGGKVTFDNVSFAYRGNDKGESERNALHDISFRIDAGETVAFVGHSGAGKSTIVTLLLRGYDPESGRIAIDNVDMKLLDLPTYLRQVGYVEQHVELFDDTLRSNILFGIPDSERAEAEKRLPNILSAARIDQFLPRVGPKGLNMIIGEKGVRLSGGERQRVGIARALIKDPRILIFDEATSSLDSENEALIHDAIKEALVGRTGIIIAHRLSTVRDADKIIMFKEGRIIGMGKHDILLRNCPEYKNLVERQLGEGAIKTKSPKMNTATPEQNTMEADSLILASTADKKSGRSRRRPSTVAVSREEK